MTPDHLPHLAGVYTSEHVAGIIRDRLRSAGLPVALSSCALKDGPPGILVEHESGRPVSGSHAGPVWVVRTDYAGTR